MPFVQFFSYLFWPNPGNASYSSPKILLVIVFCLLLVVASFGLNMWRSKLSNPITKKLSKSWSAAAFWFGLIGLLLIISRVEGIQFVAMRFLWVLWFIAAAAYIYIQFRIFRTRHYEILPQMRVDDPRAKYLPKAKRK